MTKDQAPRDHAVLQEATGTSAGEPSDRPPGHLKTDDIRLLALAVGALGGRWVLPILTRLCVEPTQFNQLQRDLAVSSKVLTGALRAMVRDGLVVRTPPDHPGSKGSYSLTQRSTDLQPALAALHDWARNHGADLERARTAVQKSQPSPAAPMV